VISTSLTPSSRSPIAPSKASSSFERWAREADVTTQRFVVRSDLACSSTIGPITAAELGIRTVDAGNPMLSMHSCREVAAAADVPKMIDVMKRFFDA
jgi:aspartyl aminopeptidase